MRLYRLTDAAAYWLYRRLPFDSRIAWWLLPYAGRFANATPKARRKGRK